MNPAGRLVAILIKEISEILSLAGIENGRHEARLLIAHVQGCSPQMLLAAPEKVLSEDQARQILELAAQRANRRPMSHILGQREFWSLGFKVTKDTLDPRADSETLIQAVVERFDQSDKDLRILDMGTGSGCLLLSLLHEWPHASGVGVDVCASALEVAGENAACLGLESRATFVQGDWGAPFGRKDEGFFDIIISNPPYIRQGDIEGLAPEVGLYEPRQALAGGADGLDCYRALAPHARRLLSPKGALFLELGEGQGQEVVEILKPHGFSQFYLSPDLAGIDRCLRAGF